MTDELRDGAAHGVGSMTLPRDPVTDASFCPLCGAPEPEAVAEVDGEGMCKKCADIHCGKFEDEPA